MSDVRGRGGEERGRERERGSERVQDRSHNFCKLNLTMTYHQPYSIRHTDQILIQYGRESCKGVKTKALGDWGPL